MSFHISGQELDLTKIESRILYCLFVLNYLNKKKEEVVNIVWAGRVINGQTLRSHLFNLNSKLKVYNIKILINDDGVITCQNITNYPTA